MAVTVAKPAVKIPAKPIMTVVPPVASKPVAPVAPVAPAAAVQAEVTDPEAAETAADAAEAKEPRKTRKDFPTWEGFCDYKIGGCNANVTKWQARVKIWEDKKLHKDADIAEKKEKKSEKLLAAFIKIQLDMGTQQAKIDAMVAALRAGDGETT